MSLRNKLSNRTAVIFGGTLGFVLLGTYLLYQQYTRDIYFKKLLGRANTAAFFYLEKDELTSQRYREIERKYRQITNEAIRLYDASTFNLFVDDTLHFDLSQDVLRTIMRNGSYLFDVDGRQLAGIFYEDNEGDFIIVASGIDITGNNSLGALRWMLFVFFVLGLLVNYVMTGWLARQTFQPFSKLIKKVNSISAENLHTRMDLPAGKADELGDLIVTFNYFLERLENAVQAQRSFLKNASHELRTPLAIIIGDIEVALKHPRSVEEYVQVMTSLKEEALRLKSMTEGLLMLSGLETQQPQMEAVRIDEVLWNVLEKTAVEYPAAVVQVDFDSVAQHEQLLTVQGNRELLFVALSNLLDNAIKFSGRATVSLTVAVNNHLLEIIVADQGPGISAEEKEKVFELFYRSRQTRQITGNGIGLYLTRQILDLHHIVLKIEDRQPSGTIARLIFPDLKLV